MMDYGRCIICQKVTADDLHCPASNLDSSMIEETHCSFISDWERFCNASIAVDVQLPLAQARVVNLVTHVAKMHKNCRRVLRKDRLESKQKTSQKRRDESPVPCTSAGRRTRLPPPPNTCLFCMKSDEKNNILHDFQKVELTEDYRKKALFLNDCNVLMQLSIGDVVAFKLKYHMYCLVSFNHHYENL
jgi:hypothetical protein